MVGVALRQLALTAAGSGELAGEGVRRGRAEHPVCGDVVQLDLRLDDQRIVALAWRAAGCPATVAVAAAAFVAWNGVKLVEAPASLRAKLAALGDLGNHERHAERLVLAALQVAR